MNERGTQIEKIRGKKVKIWYHWKTHPTANPPEVSHLKEYDTMVMVIPGRLYRKKEDTVFFYSNRNGKHVTCMNKGGLQRRSVDYLGKELFGTKPDRIISPNSFIVVLKNTFPKTF